MRTSRLWISPEGGDLFVARTTLLHALPPIAATEINAASTLNVLNANKFKVLDTFAVEAFKCHNEPW